MFGITDLGLFIIAGLMLNITPGVDMLYIIRHAGSQGLRAAIVAILGINTGCMIHLCIAVMGLSALLITSSLAFTFIKYLGGAYLIYLGIHLLWQKKHSADLPISSEHTDLIVVFKQGVLINLLNPKIALFFLAFIPQFIDASNTQKSLAFMLLGLIFNINGILVALIIAWLAVKTKRSMITLKNGGRLFKNIIGVGFIFLGIKLVIER